jgi:hypothetical protein
MYITELVMQFRTPGEGGLLATDRARMSLSMHGTAAIRTSASPEGPYIMRQIPDVLVGFDSSKGGHPAQTNSIFYNPEQFAIGVLLHLG